VLLLDEPLSALDAKIRVSLRNEIRTIQRGLGITTVYVTHDQEEALSLSDRIVVMSEGRVEQIGQPFEIYNFPKTSFVASFIGTLNLLRGRVSDPAGGRIVVDGQEIVAARGLETARAGDLRSVAVRPEAVSVGDAADGNRMTGTVEDVVFLGPIVRIRVRFTEHTLSLDTFNSPGLTLPRPGQPLAVTFRRDAVLTLDAPPSPELGGA
jgi:putative spermidine/putrescine transport system ATP-binding protein